MLAPMASNCHFTRLATLLTLLLLSAISAAQVGTVLDSSKLPACALKCQTLLTAQAGCVPPAAAVTSQATYQSCFLESAFLANYKAGIATGVCDSECPSTDDRNKILSWYTSLKNGGVVVTPNAGTNTASSTSSAATSTASTTTSSTASSNTNSHPTW